MTVEELANKRYGGEFVFYFDKGLRRRDVVDVPCYMNILPK